jgi:hypothetical protein
MLRRGLPQFGGEAVLPVVVFYGVWRVAGLASGIVASTALCLLLAAWLVRRGREVTMVALGVVVVVVQAAVGLASQNPTVYLAQPVVLNALWGLAYFGSVAVGRPLVGVFANAWYPFPPWFRASEPYRREFTMQSLVWGVACLTRAGLRLWALLASGVAGFVMVSVVTSTPLVVALIAWGIWHARRAFGRVEPTAAVA